MIEFSKLEALVNFAKVRCQRGLFNGQQTPSQMALLDYCKHIYIVAPDIRAMIIFSRDTAHHSCGWWKNPDYERCYHLSLSFKAWPSGAALHFEKKQAKKIAEAFFESSSNLLWIEPPYSDIGKKQGVFHYRLFCDQLWKPILPRGEVYSKENTPADWKSFSELHGTEIAD